MWKIAVLCVLLSGCATVPEGTYLSPEDEAILVRHFNAMRGEIERLRCQLSGACI